MKKLTIIFGVAALAWGGVHLIPDGENHAIVERIIDGDTLDASIKRKTVRIRLLNIDTPEIGQEGNPSECFAEDAKQRLEELVPPGTKVHLEYDQERTDKYGRTLAGVFLEEQFVNEQLASEGLARAILVEPNSRFYQQIRDAEASSRATGVGIFGATPGCFTADQELQDAIDSIIQEDRALAETDLNDPASISVTRKRLKTIKRQQDRLRNTVGQNELYYEEELARFLDEIGQHTENTSKQLEETAARAHALEAERKARKLEERRRLAEEKRKNEELRTQQNHLPSPPAPDAAIPTQHSAPSAPAVDNYTGCRAYGGSYVLGNVDKNGRRYAKIDCSTKVQIG